MREELKKDFITKKEACAYFNLKETDPILLIFGGSQGSSALNQILLQLLDTEKKMVLLENLQVIHLTGNRESVSSLEKSYAKQGIRARVKPFEQQMGRAWQAADLVLARAGASTIAEAIEFEVPAILVPYPQATDNHQLRNAEFLAQQIGGGEILVESQLNPLLLCTLLQTFFNEEASKLKQMKGVIKLYKDQVRPRNFCSLITDFLMEK